MVKVPSTRPRPKGGWSTYDPEITSNVEEVKLVPYLRIMLTSPEGRMDNYLKKDVSYTYTEGPWLDVHLMDGSLIRYGITNVVKVWDIMLPENGEKFWLYN